jgi:PIN domain nuclease of toxin-antitoxin system
MGKKTDTGKKILVDADSVFHFLFAGELGKMTLILPKHQFYMLDMVYDELTVVPRCKTQIDNLLNNFAGAVKPLPFPEDEATRREYFSLMAGRKGKGKGEHACMAVAKNHGYDIMSSNWADIYDYCEEHKISHYSTYDMLYIAYKAKLMTEQECEYFISAVRGKGGKMKFTMKQYIEMVREGHRKDLHG